MSNPVADDLEIRQLVATYADAVNRVDESLWVSTWAFDFVAQLVYQGTVHIEGDQATGRWYLSEHLRPAGSETGWVSIGT